MIGRNYFYLQLLLCTRFIFICILTNRVTKRKENHEPLDRMSSFCRQQSEPKTKTVIPIHTAVYNTQVDHVMSHKHIHLHKIKKKIETADHLKKKKNLELIALSNNYNMILYPCNISRRIQLNIITFMIFN